MVDVLKYPIAELFCAPQGEGAEVGRLMIFLRLAGCTVGTRYPKESYLQNVGDTGLFPIYTNECHIYDGRTMACDTDYRNNIGTLTLQEICDKVDQFNCDIVCITGGEPLMHDLLPLLLKLKEEYGKVLHLETSGTILLDASKVAALEAFDYIAISPKLGFLDEYVDWADEIKILVDNKFDWASMPESLLANDDKIFLQPINAEHTVSGINMQRCIQLQQQNPRVRLSTQSHKVWGTL